MRLSPALAALLLATAAPVRAADPAPSPSLNTRVDRVEKELRAVQRKVFPGGSPAFFEPEIAAPAPGAAPASGPTTPPLGELTSRVDGLERELERLTGQLEQDEHRLTLLSQQSAADRQEFDARLKAVEARAPVGGEAVVAAPAGDAATPFRTPPSPPRGGTRTPARAEPASDDTPPPAAPLSAAESGDPAEAAYMAGYRLWADRKYAAAEDALGKAAAQYPKHRRASYARNLQGRAFLDDGQPAEAARALYANYQKDPRGERAPESLFYLGDALTRLKKYDDACRAYGELNTVYGSTMADSLRSKLPAARKAARCGDADAEAAPTKATSKTATTAATRPGTAKKTR